MTEVQEAKEMQDNVFELSPTQRLAVRQLASNGEQFSGVLHATCVLPSTQALDETLSRLDCLVGQHEILRTKVEHIEGVHGDVQVIEEQPGYTTQQLEFGVTEWTDDSPDVAVNNFVCDHWQHFRPEAGEFFKLISFPFGEQGVCLVMVFDARLVDRYSCSRLLNELFCNRLAPVPDPGDEILQYVDVAMWLDELSEEPEASSGREYWRQYLAAERAYLQLPVINGKVSGEISGDDYQLLKAVNSSLESSNLTGRLALEQLDLESYLLACWQAVLCRYSGQTSYVHFVTLSGREMEELSPVVGLLERSLPLCDDISDDVSLRDLAFRNRNTLDKHAAQLEYFTVDTLDKTGSWFSALTERPGVNFAYQDQAAPAIEDHVGNTAFRHGGYGLLQMQIDHKEEALLVRLNGATAISGSVLSAIMKAYLHLVRTGIDALDQTIEQQALALTQDLDATTSLLAHEQNLRTAEEGTVLDMFSEHVRNNPEATALTCEGETVTFAQLDAMSGRVARHLCSISGDKSQPVMLVLNRSMEMVAAILGVMKAGYGYLPIDPKHPGDRIAFIIDDANVDIIVTSTECLQCLPESEARIVSLEDALAHEDADLELTRVSPSDLAYIIYTSGSTGLPKGVEISHRNLYASTRSRLSYYGEEPPTYLILSSYGFDSSVAVLFHALCSGGQLHLLRDGMERNVDLVADYILDHQVSMMLALPSLYGLILDALGERRASSLRNVIVAGESCRAHDVARHFEFQPETRLYNEYGPTEGCVWATVHECRVDDGDRPFVPIGKAIGSARVAILDSARRPVPFGAVGELWISGHGVSAGYVNRTELTEEKFKVLALEGSEQRAYKTGDRVVADADGNILFLGRVDQQVKLRGYRIELEEIEAVLCRHHAVDEAAVVVLEHGASNDKRLAAFIVSAPSGTGAEKDTIREYLAEQLPEYMLPQQLAIIDDLPKNANGKVDRNILSSKSVDLLDEKADYVEPETATQATVSKIWADILEVDTPLGQRDDFFMLGGNSILVPRVVQALRDRLSVPLPFVAVFENPVLSDLAEVIDVLLTQENMSKSSPDLDENMEEIVF